MCVSRKGDVAAVAKNDDSNDKDGGHGMQSSASTSK